MKFDELKPGMFLYDTKMGFGTQARSWLVIKRKFSNIVIFDEYWEEMPKGRFFKDYDSEIDEYEWNSGNIYSVYEPATPEQAQELIVAVFEKSRSS